MTRQVALRRLVEDDWREWRRLRRASLTEAPEAFGSTLAQWSGDGDTEDRWRARLRDVALHLVAEVDGEPVGVVAATAPAETGGVELISLWVAPTARGRGCGAALVTGVLGWAADEHPAAPVELSVGVGNQVAWDLYARHGFVAAGSRPAAGREMRMRRAAGVGSP